jgi:GAF domain-containing protein
MTDELEELEQKLTSEIQEEFEAMDMMGEDKPAFYEIQPPLMVRRAAANAAAQSSRSERIRRTAQNAYRSLAKARAINEAMKTQQTVTQPNLI